MGTNFYLHEKQPNTCPHCGQTPHYEPLHIGKSSAGWCFSLHVIPQEGLNSLREWQRRWSKPGVVIKDEYGESMTPAEMLRTITKRSAYSTNRRLSELHRHPVDGHHCIGHGPGTYDYITGWFC
jgi:hypothetical protein